MRCIIRETKKEKYRRRKSRLDVCLHVCFCCDTDSSFVPHICSGQVLTAAVAWGVKVCTGLSPTTHSQTLKTLLLFLKTSCFSLQKKKRRKWKIFFSVVLQESSYNVLIHHQTIYFPVNITASHSSLGLYI